MQPGRVDRLIRLVAATVSVGVCSASPVASQQPKEFGKTIAAITVGQDRLDRVRSLYGAGAQTAVAAVQSLCYYIEQDQSYLSVSTFERDSRVRSVSLTTFTNVTPGCRDARIKGKHLVAVRGVALGDPMAKVVGALGKPTETGKLPMGEHELTYADYPIVGGRATCQFEHDKLVMIGVELD